MTIRYTIEQLLCLRASKLARIPTNLPPVEEWMGPPPDSKQKNLAELRGKSEDQNAKGEVTPQPSARKGSGAETGGFVLGPPKTSFASANSRGAAKPSAGDPEEESSTSTHRPALQQRFSKDQGVSDGDSKNNRFNGINGRRSARDDREGWQTGRRRHQEGEMGEGRHRGTSDREKGRWDREQDGSSDVKRTSREGARREGRHKFEQPWFRREKGQEDHNGSVSANKRSEWRKDGRLAKDHDEDRSARFEQDPEWMDPNDVAQPQQAHTQEEFQRWKESMKASEAEAAAANTNASEGEAKTTELQPKQASALHMPAFMDTAEIGFDLDKFFGAYGERQSSSEQKPAETKTQRKPRFAALFTSQPDQSSNDPAQASEEARLEQPRLSENPTSLRDPPGSGDTSSTDQEHFQRVLQMLAGRSNNGSRPQTAEPSTSSATPLRPQPILRQQETTSASDDVSSKQDLRNAQRTTSHEGNSGNVLDQIARIPRQSTPHKDTDLLLKLMQQSSLASERRSPQSVPLESQRAQPERPRIADIFPQQPPIEQSGNERQRAIFDDPAISKMHRSNLVSTGNDAARQSNNGPPAELFDDSLLGNPHQIDQRSTLQADSRKHLLPPGLPAAIPRPPGFEQMIPNPAQPPTWSHQAPRPPSSSQHVGLPPLMNPPPGIPSSAAGFPPPNSSYSSGPPSRRNPSSPPSSHMMPLPNRQPTVQHPQQQQQQQQQQQHPSRQIAHAPELANVSELPSGTVPGLGPGPGPGPGPGGLPPFAPPRLMNPRGAPSYQHHVQPAGNHPSHPLSSGFPLMSTVDGSPAGVALPPRLQPPPHFLDGTDAVAGSDHPRPF